MNQNTSNLSQDRQGDQTWAQFGKQAAEVTQQNQTIDHANRRNGFRTEESFLIAAGRLVSASILSKSAQMRRHGDSQAPEFDAESLMPQGIVTAPPETLHNPAIELASIASPERAIQGGGEGVEASARSQSSQYIPPSRKFSQCHP